MVLCMNRGFIKFIFMLVGFTLMIVPYLLLAPQVHKEQIEKERLEEEARKKFIEERRTYLLGKFDQSVHPEFVKVSADLNMGQGAMYLRKETYNAFLKMREAALKEGITLNVASATRNFDYQKTLWEKKWNGITLVEGKSLPESIPNSLERFRKILEYSAAPGTSRHHWGTDIDINGADVSYFNTERGIKEYAWLTQNAPLFGFCQTYNERGLNRPNGYNEEKWHWSYLPVSRLLTIEYKNLIAEKDITGFAGDSFVKNLDLVNNYILALNPNCL